MALVSEISDIGRYFVVNRRNLMKNAKISRKTYNKCMKELQEFGYIKYEPANSAYSQSMVLLKRL